MLLIHGRFAVLVLVAVALAVMVFVSSSASSLGSSVREGFDASNTDAGAAVAASALRDAPVSRIMTPFGAVRACGSANTVCGTRDGYFAGDLVVGESLGVAGDVSIKGNLKEVTDVSILRALSVNGMANFDKNMAVGGRVIAQNADIAGSVSAQSANVRGNLRAAGLNIRGDARIAGSADVSRNISTNAGVLALSGAGYFKNGVGTGGNMVALGDVMAGGDHLTAGSVIAARDVIAGRRVISNGDAKFQRSLTANGSVDVKGDLGVKKSAKFGGALDVGQSVTVGGNIMAEGRNGLVVNNGALRVGALPAGAEGDALASGLHVERGGGRRTSFPRSGDNRIDGTLRVSNKVCVGGTNKPGEITTVKKWVSKGCWKDNHYAGLPRPLHETGGTLSGTNDQIREKCKRLAVQKNRDIFAIQNKTQCMTGSTAKDDYRRDGVSSKCASMMGGPWLNSVWVNEDVEIGAGECIDNGIITTFKGYPTFFNSQISDAAAAANKKLGDMATSIDKRFSGTKLRLDELSKRITTNATGLAAAKKVDEAMFDYITTAEFVLGQQDDGIVEIDNRNDVQDVRLDTLERRLETLEGRMLGAVKAAMVNDQTRLTTTCDNKPPPPPPKSWKLTVWQDMGFTGNVQTYDKNSMNLLSPGVYITGGPFGVSSWELDRGDTEYAALYFSNAKSWETWERNYFGVGNKGTQKDFDFRFIIVRAKEAEPAKPVCA